MGIPIITRGARNRTRGTFGIIVRIKHHRSPYLVELDDIEVFLDSENVGRVV